MTRTLFLLSSSLLLSACNTIPDKLDVPKHTALQAYPAQATNIEGQQARWGGYIAAIENRKDSTVLDIVNLKLGSSSRPVKSDETLGRFRAYVEGYLDPHIYQPGRMVTALGRAGKNETVMIGDHPLIQPSLYAKEIHLWPKVSEKSKTETYYVPYVILRPVYVPR